MNTSKLTGAALDWAVCEATGLLAAYTQFRTGKNFLKVWGVAKNAHLHPSTDWAHGGPIIEREAINMTRWSRHAVSQGSPVSGLAWMACDRGSTHVHHGPTYLIAAMRCYVASKLGDDVDVPEELQ